MTPARGQWAWLNGRKDANNLAGIYRTKGVPDPANLLGARSSVAYWVGTDGKLYLFGGYGMGSIAVESQLNGQPGSYGSKGVAAASNLSEGRYACAVWSGRDGFVAGASWQVFFLFGGNVHLDTSTVGQHNDLWRYIPSINRWERLSGSSGLNAAGVVATAGLNTLGGRSKPTCWTDPSGKLYLFGGSGRDTSGYLSFLGDLWVYTPDYIASRGWELYR